jgi:hypothetical protein
MVAIRCAATLLCLTAAAGCAGEREKSAAQILNLALGRPVSMVGGGGEPRVVTDGRILSEAAPPVPGESVPIGDVRDFIIVDLGAVQPVGALLLQADAADVYFIELSMDGVAWRVAWRVAPMTGATGLHTRRTVLFRPVPSRFLRARATTARSAAISEIQAFSAEPAAWPPLDRSDRGAHRPLWPGLTRERLTTLFGALAALLMVAAAWNRVARRLPPAAGERRLGKGMLVVVAVASLVGWPNFLNFHYYGFVHTWEFFHYFMGAKYLPELGYSRLYTCAATVDAEDGIDLRGRIMRDLRDNRLVPTEAELERSVECRSRFSADRWKEFQHDARFFRHAMGPENWLAVRTDHGFNGTPAWAAVGGLLARLGPASWPLIISLAILDVVLILAMLALIGRSFGLEAACIAAGYWGVNTLAPFGWTGGGFLRYDWLFWLIGGVAALRGGRPALAGFALGYSTLLRVFPICAIAGLALKALVEAASTRSYRPLTRHAPLAAGIAAAAILFGGGSALMAGGAGIWREFAVNSAKHRATAVSNLIGVEAFLSYEDDGRLELMTDPLLLDRFSAWKARVAAAESQTRTARWFAAALFALLLALAVRDAPDWAATVLGLGLMPMLFVLSSYYYCGLVAFAALVSVRSGNGLALASLAWGTTVISGLWPSPDAQYAGLSLAVVAFVMGVMGVYAWRSARNRTAWDDALQTPVPAGSPGT